MLLKRRRKSERRTINQKMSQDKPISENMSQEVDDMPIFESGVKIDVSKYNGTWSEIAKIETINTFSDWTEGSYDDKGQYVKPKFVAGLKRPVKSLRISSKVLEVVQREGKAPIEVKASMLFGLKRKVMPDGTEVWGASANDNAKLQKFLKKQKVTTVQALKGTKILLTTRPSKNPNDTREYLGFVTE